MMTQYPRRSNKLRQMVGYSIIGWCNEQASQVAVKRHNPHNFTILYGILEGGLESMITNHIWSLKSRTA